MHKLGTNTRHSCSHVIPLAPSINNTSLYFRAICDDYFQKYDEKDRIYRFSSPKVLRLLEILHQFKPEKSPDDSQGEGESDSLLEVEGTGINKCVSGNAVPVNGECDTKVRSTKDDETVQRENGNPNHSTLNMCKNTCSEETGCCGCEKQRQREDAGGVGVLQQHAENIPSGAKQLEVSHEPQGCLNGETDCQPLTCNNIGVLSVDCVASNLCSDSASDVHISQVVPSLQKCTSCESELSDGNVTNIPVMCKVLNSNRNCKISVIDTLSPTHNDCDKVGNEVGKENSVKSADVINMPVTPSKNRTDLYSRNRGSRFLRRGHQKEDGNGCVRGGRSDATGRHYRNVPPDDLDALCGIIFVEQRFTAKILYHLLNVSTSMLSWFLHWDA
jgi:hypothetical protein